MDNGFFQICREERSFLLSFKEFKGYVGILSLTELNTKNKSNFKKFL